MSSAVCSWALTDERSATTLSQEYQTVVGRDTVVVMSVVYFLVLVGVLVVIHEFGHFVAAKLLDFKVTRFSVGFGRPLFRIRAGETEYQLAVMPLGGYVRILGEDPSEDVPSRDAHRSFAAKPLWQRLVVVFAGPAANLLLPVLIYFVLHAGHTELPAAVVGDILPDTPAERAGIQPGDQIVAIGDTTIRYWEDVEREIHDGTGRELRFRIRRGERELDTYVAVVENTMRRRDMSSTRHGLAGISWRPFLPQVGIVDRTSPAGRAGIQTGDLVISVDGKHVGSWTALRKELSGSARRMNVALLRSTPVEGLPHVKLLSPRLADVVAESEVAQTGRLRPVHGLHPAELFVAQVEPGSPADVAGLRSGDHIRILDGEPVRHWLELDQRLQSRPDHTFTIAWARTSDSGGELEMRAALTQIRQTHTDEYGQQSEVLAFGAAPDLSRGHGEVTSIDRRMSYSASKAVERTGETIGVMTTGLWSIVRGRSPSDEIGGPIMMYRVAAVSGHKGWEAFLLMLALVSVSVGLINLLPIPVLDGGHLLIFTIEAVRRRPLAPRSRDRIMVVGLAIVGLITVLALKNDVMRYIL